MKKIIIALMLCVASFGFAQDASIGDILGVSLDCYAQQFDGQKYLIIKYVQANDYILPEETAMKLKFMNGETRCWKGYCVNIAVRTDSKTNNSQFSSETKVEERTTKILRFDLTDEDIDLLESGVERITLYTIPKVYRKEYTKDKVGHKLFEAFKKAEELF